MNPRITYVNSGKVNIKRRDVCSVDITGIWSVGNCLCERHSSVSKHTDIDVSWDKEGIDARIEAERCWQQTGSFEALLDTSPVPYVGKKMMLKTPDEDNGRVVTIGVIGNQWIQIKYDGDDYWSRTIAVGSGDLRALEKPKPEVRPYLAVEAVHHIGRRFKVNFHEIEERLAKSMDLEGYYDSRVPAGKWTYNFLAEKATWSDDGTPCGVVLK